MTFSIDPRLADGCFFVTDWSLSRLFLKNNALYPWFILVPRLEGLIEIHDLPQASQHQLMDEISRLSSLLQQQLNPRKINVAALGNQVSQLHLHVVARFEEDPLWPEGIWQAAQASVPYAEGDWQALLRHMAPYL